MSVELSAHDRFQGYAFSFSYEPACRAGRCSSLDASEKATLWGMTVMNVLGYFPGVSLIVGIARIIFSQVAAVFTKTDEMPEPELQQIKAIQEAQLVRGALECCSLFAPLMLITDVTMTILMKSGV